MTESRTKKLATLFAGLSSNSRLAILMILKKRGELSVSALAGVLGIAFKNTSRNLGILKSLGLVEADGRQGQVFYRLNPDMEKDTYKVIKVILGR